LLKAYKIITGDDPDQNASDDEPIARAPRAKAQQPQQPQQTQTTPPAVQPCAECAQAIMPTKLNNGYMATPAEVAGIALKRYGRPLCAECMKKIEEAKK
jgi:hypothetical protein